MPAPTKRCFIRASSADKPGAMSPQQSIVLAMASFGLTLLFTVLIGLLGGLLMAARSGWERCLGHWERLRSESEARALKLLKGWLSPAQLSAYEDRRYFEVVGCDSGTVYRIHHGTQANIDQLDALGQPVCRWCFVPRGGLVAGDVMLAQKIALETYESSALGVANRFTVMGNPRPTIRSNQPLILPH
jgi:hypothetical protein